MIDYRNILRLKSLGYTNSEIAANIHCSRTTVVDALKQAELRHISWPLGEDISNDALEIVLYPNRQKNDADRLIPDYAKIHKELSKKGVTLTLLWTEYCAKAELAGKKPYMSTQFSDNYRKWARASKATLRITRKPGDQMEVDWAGATLNIFDSITGESYPAYLFVAVLSCSGLIYAEICTDMKTENFINCHIHAFEYFGDTTRLLIPDNLKAGITKNTRYETVINRTYKEMADHYGTTIVPARVKAPDDKPNAEGSVKFATTWILAALRNERFFSINEAKRAVSEKLEELNNKPFQKKVGSRRSAFECEEKAFMQPLPFTPFELATWSSVKVQNDYLISDGINKYSVPFDLIGEQVDVRVTSETIEVFFKNNRVATHIRQKTVCHEPIRETNHMPPAHQKYLAYGSEEFYHWADSIGLSTHRVVEYFLTSQKEPEQGYKYCVSLMKAAERYSDSRIEKACERLLSVTPRPSLRNIISILKNGQDKVPLSKPVNLSSSESNGRSTGITRGASSFRNGGDAK